VLASARVLFYASVDDSLKFAGRSLLFVDGKELGKVPCLAICDEKKSGEVLLFHCDSEWNVLGCSAYVSVDKAKARAERIYAGISSRWVDAKVSQEMADTYIDENRRALEMRLKTLRQTARCSFCGRKYEEVPDIRVNEAEDAFICRLCVEEFYQSGAK